MSVSLLLVLFVHGCSCTSHARTQKLIFVVTGSVWQLPSRVVSGASPLGFAFGSANARGINGAGRPHPLAKHTVGGGGSSSNSIVAMMVVVGPPQPPANYEYVG